MYFLSVKCFLPKQLTHYWHLLLLHEKIINGNFSTPYHTLGKFIFSKYLVQSETWASKFKVCSDHALFTSILGKNYLTRAYAEFDLLQNFFLGQTWMNKKYRILEAVFVLLRNYFLFATKGDKNFNLKVQELCSVEFRGGKGPYCLTVREIRLPYLLKPTVIVQGDLLASKKAGKTGWSNIFIN